MTDSTKKQEPASQEPAKQTPPAKTEEPKPAANPMFGNAVAAGAPRQPVKADNK